MFYDLFTNYNDIFVENMGKSFCTAKVSPIFFSTKNIGEFEILAFEI